MPPSRAPVVWSVAGASACGLDVFEALAGDAISSAPLHELGSEYGRAVASVDYRLWRGKRFRGRPGFAGESVAFLRRTPGDTPSAFARRRSVSMVMFTLPPSILRMYWTSSPVRASSSC